MTLTACDAFDRSSSDSLAEPMEINVNASTRTATVGDTITIAASTRNLMGRDASIEWLTTGGQITPADDRRTARVRFSTPGTYTVTARAMLNGVVVDSDSVNINVRDLDPNQPMRSGETGVNDRDHDRNLDTNRDINENEPRPMQPRDLDDDDTAPPHDPGA